MNILVNYLQTEGDAKELLNNLAPFKVELFQKSIVNLKIEDKIKNEVL